MKKVLLSVFIVVLGVSAFAGEEKSLSLVISPLQLPMVSFDGRFAFKIHDRIAITLPVVAQVFPVNNLTQDLMYFSAGIGAQIFLTDTAFTDGIYIEPRMTAGWSQITPNPKHSVRGTNSPFLKTSLMFGYGWVWESGFTMNLGLGGYYNQAFGDEAMAIKKVLVGAFAGAANVGPSMWGITSGFGPAGEFSIGYSW